MFLTVIAYVLLGASVLTSFVALRGEDPWSRLLGYTLIASKVNVLIVVLALMVGNSFYLDIALVYIVLSYIGVLVLADYMAGRGANAERAIPIDVVPGPAEDHPSQEEAP